MGRSSRDKDKERGKDKQGKDKRRREKRARQGRSRSRSQDPAQADSRSRSRSADSRSRSSSGGSSSSDDGAPRGAKRGGSASPGPPSTSSPRSPGPSPGRHERARGGREGKAARRQRSLLRYASKCKLSKLRRLLKKCRGGGGSGSAKHSRGRRAGSGSAGAGADSGSAGPSSGGLDLNAVDEAGGLRQTALHLACLSTRRDSGAVVKELLRRGADACAQDSGGNSPLHLAAMAHNLEAVMHLLQCDAPPDIELVNAAGQSIRSLVGAMSLGGGPGTEGGSPEVGPPPPPGPGSHMAGGGGGGGGAACYGRADSGDEEGEARQRRRQEAQEDAEWRRKLREVDSEGEDEWRGLGVEEAYGAGLGLGPEGAPVPETEDEWADRIWAQMQAKRRAEAAAAARAFAATREEQRQRSQAREEEAARESWRILQEERAKDAEWRRKHIGPQPRPALPPGPTPAAAAAPPPAHIPSIPELRATYNAKWRALDAKLLAASAAAGAAPALAAAAAAPAVAVHMAEVPWPLPDALFEDGASGAVAAAAAGSVPPPAQRRALLRDVLLHGAQGPGDVRKRLRAEILRWHPDKFVGRFGRLLAASERGAVLARVQEVSQTLTQLISDAA